MSGKGLPGMSRGSYVWRGFCSTGFCPEGVLSMRHFPTVLKHDICYGGDSANLYFIHIKCY